MSMFKKWMLVAIVSGLAISTAATAQAGGGSCTAPAAPPMTTAQATARRSNSYEPGTMAVRTYRAPTMRSRSNVPTYLQGGAKALGKY